MDKSIISIIQGMLAPGIMISACGLLLLGMNNKYSLVVSRIRALNTELRKSSPLPKEREECILIQMPLLVKRMKIIRNAVWLYTVSVALFIFSIIFLGLYLSQINSPVISTISLFLFILGMFSVLAGIFNAAKEVRLGYKIVLIETQKVVTKDSAN
jgi:hypothetical protein